MMSPAPLRQAEAEAQARLLHSLFEAQARRAPQADALVTEERRLTYRELDRRANLLAWRLRREGVGPEVLVGVLAERSVELVVGVLAVLKAGGAYVPLEPAYPPARLAHILGLARPRLVLAQQHLLPLLPAPPAARVLPLEEALASEPLGAEAEAPPPLATPDNAAYVLFTSGSTGQPKGVLVTHGNAEASTRTRLAFYTAPVAGMPLLHSFAFDVSVGVIFWALGAGGKLVLPPLGREQDAAWLVELFEREGLSHIMTTHFVCRSLLEAARPGQLRALRVLVAGGEPCPASLGESQRRHAPWATLYNEYGPSETTVWSTVHEAREGFSGSRLPIGHALPGVTLHLLDGTLTPVPWGELGELFIGGEGVARGYLGAADLTAERFIPNPFGPPGARLYRTGDVVRALPDGALDFVGRSDEQAKVRGFRIELGEVEAALARYPGVRQAIAVVREDSPGDRRLVAYFLCQPDAVVAVSTLRAALAAALPEYMVPSALVRLESFPTTAHGKVDRQRLPPPPRVRPALATPYVAPRNVAEQTLADIWAELLRLDVVGVHDNFFELGGDSILALQIMARAARAGLKLTQQQMFQHPTLAALVESGGLGQGTLAAQGPVSGPVPLSPVQRWFFAGEHVAPAHFNLSYVLEVRERPDAAKLEEALYHLACHHDALRMRLTRTAEGWTQHNVAPGERPPLERVAAAAILDVQVPELLERVGEGLWSSFNLAEGPLLKAALVDLGPQRPARLVLASQHLVTDTVAIRILVEDLETLYRQLLLGQPPRLSPRTTSFKEWAERLADYAQTQEVREAASFWLTQPWEQVRPVPRDAGTSGGNTLDSARQVSITLTAEETAALLHEVPAAFRTRVNDLLLTALVEAFAPLTGSRTLLVFLESHGREDVFPDVDLSRTVGWFTSFYPLPLSLAPEGEPPVESLKAIKEQLRRVPRRGFDYPLLRYLTRDAALTARLAALPPAQVVFNYLGQMDASFSPTSLLRMTGESPGPEWGRQGQRVDTFEVVAQVAGGRLEVHWLYSENLHRRATVEALAGRYRDALRHLLRECQAPGAGGVTPSDFPLAALDQESLDVLAEDPRDIEDVYPLSPLQQGLLFHSLEDPEAGFYTGHCCFELEGPVREDVLEAALQRLVDRHPVLRSSVHWEELPEFVQVVHRRARVHLARHDLRGLPPEARRARLDAFLEATQREPLVLDRAPPFRVTAHRLADDALHVTFTFHHLTLDGWSVAQLLDEWVVVSAGLVEGREVALEPVPPYRDYIAWLGAQDFTGAREVWRRRLEGFRRATSLEALRAGPGDGAAGLQVEFLSEEETEALGLAARRQSLTLSTVVQAAWALVLSASTGERDVVFGSTVSGRMGHLPRIERMVGVLINTLPVRVTVDPAEPVSRFLGRLQEQLVELGALEHTPLSELRRWTALARGEPLFHTFVTFENYPGATAQETSAGRVRLSGLRNLERINYPLSLSAVPGARLCLRMAHEGMSATGVAAFLESLRWALSALVNEPARSVGALLAGLPHFREMAP